MDEDPNVEAQDDLEKLYADGQGLQQDDVMAVNWFRLAVKQGYAEAEFNLGMQYAKGLGVHQDAVQARSLYQLAADQGYTRAQLNLGLMLLGGGIASPNYIVALKWLVLAADSPEPDVHAKADEGVAFLADRMGTRQFVEGLQLAREWQPRK